MARVMHNRLAGLPIDPLMPADSELIVLGALIAACGLQLRDTRHTATQRAAATDIVVSAPENAPLGSAHWSLMAALIPNATIWDTSPVCPRESA